MITPAVQATAFMAAACRAEETARPAPRIRDEYAALFMAAQDTGRTVRRRVTDAGIDEVVERSRILDQLLLAAIERHPGAAVVNLGAGFCTRPYRLDLSACRLVVECDASEIIELKERVLAPFEASCRFTRLPMDVRAAPLSGVRAAGDGPVIVISEGLLVYLPPGELGDLARALSEDHGIVGWLADVVSVESAAGMRGVAAQAGANVDLYGLDSLDAVESLGWVCVDYRILPSNRRTTSMARKGAASRGVVDGVVAWQRR